jgi:hypothetical protein
MHIEQTIWSNESEPQVASGSGSCHAPQLVLAFGAPGLLADEEVWGRLKQRWPQAQVVACSTAGEISGPRVLDDTVVATAVQFESSRVRCARVDVADCRDSEAIGQLLAERLAGEELRHVFVLSDGLKVNGSALVRGLATRLPHGVSITGGLAADGPRFGRTRVCLDGPNEVESVVGVGFYGARLHVGMGSLGGWDPFGPERRITRSEGNVLYELDGKPALALYEKYLGEHAEGLPASGLLFPLTVRAHASDSPVVRTILAVDRERGSLTFAGDVPQGHLARLMHANFDRLIDGAAGAARTSHLALGADRAELAILISCVGRRLVLQQRIEEELESVQGVLGSNVVMAGFYSYGEISPFTPDARCELHNQTMTITTLNEG